MTNVIPNNEREQAVDIFLETINSDYLITWCGWLSNRFRSPHKCWKSTGSTSKMYDRLDRSTRLFTGQSTPLHPQTINWIGRLDRFRGLSDTSIFKSWQF